MRVSRLPPANSQQERRHRQDGPSRRLREVLPAHRQSRAGRARTCGSVPVLRVQRRTAMTEDEQTIERIEAQIFERYQQSGIDYLVDYLEGEQSAIDLNFYPAHERASLSHSKARSKPSHRIVWRTCVHRMRSEASHESERS